MNRNKGVSSPGSKDFSVSPPNYPNISNLLDSIDDLVFILDVSGNILQVNKSAEHKLGYDASELIDTHISELYLNEFRQEAQISFQKLINNEVNSCNIPYISKQGHTFHLETKIEEGDWNDKTIFFAISKDISNLNRGRELPLPDSNQLRYLIDNIPDFIFFKDNTCRFILANKALLDFLNLPSNFNISGKHDFDFFPEEVANAFYSEEKLILQSGKALTNIERGLKSLKNGNLKHYLISKIPIFNHNQKVNGIIGIGRNITDLKTAEEQILNNQANLSALIENISGFIWSINKSFQTTTYNTAFKNFLNKYLKIDLHSHFNLIDLLKEPYKKKWLKIYKQALKGKKFNEEQVITDGKTIRYFDVSVNPIYNPDGDVNGAAFFAQDITNRKLTEDAIRENEEKFRQLAENTTDSFILVNDKEILYVNPAFEKVYGRKMDELTPGKHIPLHWIHPKDHDRISRYLASDSYHKNRIINAQYRILKPDRSVSWVWNRCYPIYNEHGEIYRNVWVASDISKQKEYEAYFIQTKAQQKAILDNIPHLAWLKDNEGRYISVNESFANHYNLKPNEIIGKTDHDICDAELANEFAQKDKIVIQNKKQQLFEEVKQNANGLVWSETYKTPVLNDSGNVIGVTGISRDITQRKLLEDELRKSEEKFRALLQYSSDAITIVDENGIINFESSLEAKISGISICDLIGTSIFENIHKNDREKFKKALEEVIVFPVKTVKVEFRILNKSGGYNHVESILANHLENEKINGIVINSRDITRRKIAEIKEKQFNYNLEFLSSTALEFLGHSIDEDIFKFIGTKISQFIKDGIVSVAAFDEDNQLLRLKYLYGIKPFYNNLVKLLGVDLKDYSTVVDENFKKSLVEHSKSLYTFTEGLHEVFNWKMPFPIIKAIEKITGIKQIYGMGLVREGKLYGSMLIFLRNDRKLENSQTIETIIYQASIALHRRQLELELIKAKEKAVESDKIKTAFLANMSHEIRTPMNGIMGFAQILLEENLTSEEIRDYLEVINSNGNLLIKLIDDIIDFSKIETGHITITPEVFCLNDLIDSIQSSFTTENEFKNKPEVEFIVEKGLTKEYSYIETDPVRLRQVINNLVGNAIKFTESGFISLDYQQVNNNTLQFEVKDTGIGIPPEKQNVIFDRFVQADFSATRKYGGSGLGLAISKGLIELLGGKIWVTSNPGKGSEFYFTLPYKSLKSNAVEKKPIEMENIDSTRWENKTVLVVEDDKFSLKYLEALLKKYKINVLHASNGKEAIDFCKANKNIDLVLMDIQLPVISGYEATSEIKTFRKHLTIIAQTANVFDEDRQKCIDAGCSEFIAKPINLKSLVVILEKYLK